jgi:DNA-binding CsgD family transcriptional regulator
MQLSSRETRRLFTFVTDAASLGGPRPFTTALVDELTTVVDSEFATYYTFDPALGHGSDEYVPCSWEAPMPEEGWGGYPELVDPRRQDVQLWSDTLPRRVRRRYETAPFAQAMELLDCAWTVIPLTPRKGAMLNFHRQGRDFSERERCIVQALRPHVVALVRAADARRRLHELSSAVDTAEDGDGFVLLGTGGEMEYVSPPARALLRRWLGCDDGRLPDLVADWLRSESRRAGLRMERGGRRLIVRTATRNAFVLREEAVVPALLTAREQEILRHVADGKSTAQIAHELWVTPATVSKHLEHCYRKLGVTSRTAALAAAGLTASPR